MRTLKRIKPRGKVWKYNFCGCQGAPCAAGQRRIWRIEGGDCVGQKAILEGRIVSDPGGGLAKEHDGQHLATRNAVVDAG